MPRAIIESTPEDESTPEYKGGPSRTRGTAQDVESEDEMDVGSAGRKRRAGKQKETRAKRPREELYAPRGLPPLRAPFHEDLPAKQQVSDWQVSI